MGLGFLTQSSGDEKLMRFKDKKQIVFVDLEVSVGIGGSVMLELSAEMARRCIPPICIFQEFLKILLAIMICKE